MPNFRLFHNQKLQLTLKNFIGRKNFNISPSVKNGNISNKCDLFIFEF